MKINQLLAEIEKSYHGHFPDSKIIFKFGGFGQDITVKVFLANCDDEVSNKIWGNDMLSIVFQIENQNDKDGCFPKGYNLESEIDFPLVLTSVLKRYTIKTENPYKYSDGKKLSFRQVKGDEEKIIQALDKFFIQLKNSIIEDYNNENIHKDFLNIVKNKLELS